jgi:glutamate-1-semialdehyde aminotransferase/spore coat polysaccharide biosynthesis protein SpsF (cytidylyltransferase family)
MSHMLAVPIETSQNHIAGKIVAIIQARMGSSRFPGKVLSDLGGRPVLWHVIDRAKRATSIDEVVVATTESALDDSISTFCETIGVRCFRGSEEDVLDRFFNTAKHVKADVVVRITADCPLIDPEVIDQVVACFKEGDWDYVSNTLRYTYPDGLDTEVFSFAALETAWHEARKPSEREHVTPYLRTGRFRTCNVQSKTPVAPGAYRLTIDYPLDLQFIRRLYEKGGNGASLELLIELMNREERKLPVSESKIPNEGYYRSLAAQAVPGVAPPLKVEQSLAWLARSLKVIPGGSQTFSKKHTQYVKGAAPIFLQSGKGCRVTDVDGNHYIDYVQGLLPNILGYAHPEVNQAVTCCINAGHSFSLPHPFEVELAEKLTQLIPCAEMVRFGKNGSDATSGAVRLARAVTGRTRVACCGYHGWQDWYIGSTTRNGGVPQEVRNLTSTFRYNDAASLETLFDEYPNEIGAVILEPFNFLEPRDGFLGAVRNVTHRHGALLIFDEICTGFHFGLGGAQKLFGVTPDLACFGKAMANGFPLSCVVGRRDLMQTFDEIFFSFTFAGEAAALAAAMKVIQILENTDALAVIEASGKTIQDGLTVMIRENGLGERIKCIGRPQWSLLKFLDASGNDDIVLKNLFQQEAVKRGLLLLSTHNMTAAHDTVAVQETLEVYAIVLRTISEWLQDPKPTRFIEGDMSQPVFRVR